MVGLGSLFWLFIVIFAIIGMNRGWAKELLVTFSVPEEYLALPANTWEAGDEVRIYYKEPGKAARFMNITKTDIFKK